MKLNFVYADYNKEPFIVYTKGDDEVWMSKTASNTMPNVAMNHNSVVDFTENDSLFIAEPICVLERNYNIEYLKQFKYIFAWATKFFVDTEVNDKVVYVNFPSYYGNKIIDDTSWPSWNKRDDEIVFIANNKRSKHYSELYSLRLRLADWLNAHSKFKVSWYGNMPVNKRYYRGAARNKQEILRKAKFTVCMENSYDPIVTANFLTEKLPDAWLAGAVPIYMGCSNMKELGIGDDCYINLVPLRNSFRQLENRLKSFSNVDYQKMTEAYKKLDLFPLTTYDNMFDIMLGKYK